MNKTYKKTRIFKTYTKKGINQLKNTTFLSEQATKQVI